MTSYTSRNLRKDLLERLRVLAAVDQTTIEDALNQVLERGLEREALRRTRVRDGR